VRHPWCKLSILNHGINSVSREELQKSLDRLHVEIEKLEVKDAALKERLDGLISDVESQLKGSGDEQQAATLMGELQKYIEQFETEHPRVTGILNHIMVTLSNMGI